MIHCCGLFFNFQRKNLAFQFTSTARKRTWPLWWRMRWSTRKAPHRLHRLLPRQTFSCPEALYVIFEAMIHFLITDALIEWLSDLLIVDSSRWLIDWVSDLLIVDSSRRLIDWMSDLLIVDSMLRLIDWVSDLLIVDSSRWLIHQAIGCFIYYWSSVCASLPFRSFLRISTK